MFCVHWDIVPKKFFFIKYLGLIISSDGKFKIYVSDRVNKAKKGNVYYITSFYDVRLCLS